jgi:hypothetical protein
MGNGNGGWKISTKTNETPYTFFAERLIALCTGFVSLENYQTVKINIDRLSATLQVADNRS